MTERCQLLYLHSNSYAPEKERGLNPMDPKLRIEWPLPVKELSERDKNHPMIDDRFMGVKA
jgi:dTDP-4-dehydrorhamnose 3,5-epimerase